MTVPPVARPGLQGHYAGIASRFVAYVADTGATTGVFLLAFGAASFAVGVLAGHPVTWSRSGTAAVVAFGIWQFIYYAYCWGSGGKTVGMAVLGLRVVRLDGHPAGPRRAVVRTVSFPLSFLLCGLGFAGILLGSKRRALHDAIAGTAVVYAWDARAASLRFLTRENRRHHVESPGGGGAPAPRHG